MYACLQHQPPASCLQRWPLPPLPRTHTASTTTKNSRWAGQQPDVIIGDRQDTAGQGPPSRDGAQVQSTLYLCTPSEYSIGGDPQLCGGLHLVLPNLACWPQGPRFNASALVPGLPCPLPSSLPRCSRPSSSWRACSPPSSPATSRGTLVARCGPSFCMLERWPPPQCYRPAHAM